MLVSIRIVKRISLRYVLAMLVAMICVPLMGAAGQQESSASVSTVAGSMCQAEGCIEGFNLAQQWNVANVKLNRPHHLPNLLVEMTCFGWCASEKENQAWLGDHADVSTFGRAKDMDGSVAANPHLIGYVYALLWYTLDDSHPDPDNIGDKWQRDLAHWAAVRGLDEEEFYLHTAIPTAACATPSRTRACRLNNLWNGWGTHWYGNLRNAHFVEYTRDRSRRIIASHAAKESIFWDTMDSGGLLSHACGPKAPSLEYGNSCEPYEKDLVQLVIQVRDALGGRPLHVNTASYTSAVSPYNGWVAIAAGSVHTEGLNTPFYEYSNGWKHIDEMLEAGVEVAFTSNWYTREDELTRLGVRAHWKTTYGGGNYRSGLSRYKMTTLAQHYLLAPSHLSGNFYWNPNPQDWSVAYPKQWLHAVEVDLGMPIDPRRVLVNSGFDGVGQSYDLYRREYARAYVFARPTKKWSNTSWDDSTAIPVQLPEKNLSLLTPEGLSTPIHGDSILLRNGEGVILLRAAESATKRERGALGAERIP